MLKSRESILKSVGGGSLFSISRQREMKINAKAIFQLNDDFRLREYLFNFTIKNYLNRHYYNFYLIRNLLLLNPLIL